MIEAEVDAGGQRGGAVVGEAKGGADVIGDLLAGGECVVREGGEFVSADHGRAVDHVDMAGAEEEGDAPQSCGHADEPGIAGTVGVDDLDALAPQQEREAEDFKRQESAVKGAGVGGDAGGTCPGDDLALRMREK